MRGETLLVVLPPDYDSDPGRWRAWRPSRDVQEVIAPELRGPVLDIGCGDGRLVHALESDVAWIGVDLSWTQLRELTGRSVVLADMCALPFRDGVFAEVAHLWCLYHVQDPVTALHEARRVLQPEGRYYACTSARTNDPELVPEGYPPSSFDAEDAAAIVRQAFRSVEAQSWDDQLYRLETRDEVGRYCRSHLIPAERADQVDVPLLLTKRGVLLRATAT